jgi:uncharacterized protein
MYAIGKDHPHKQPCLDLLRHVADGKIDAVTNAETLQELLHRYRMIGRWPEGKKIYDRVRKIVTHVIPISAEHVDEARRLLDEYPHLMARDALHVAVCQEIEGATLCSYDRDLDGIKGIMRREPSYYI